MNKKITSLIFDVNETLLDLEPLKQQINRVLKNEQAASIWFAELLQYSLVESITGEYTDFSEIAAAVLKMNAKKYDIHLSEEEINETLHPIKKLQAYDDVKPGLQKLRDAGFQLIAFSNGKPSVLEEQLQFAEIDLYFDKILSVDTVQKYKPHPSTYDFAVRNSSSNKANCMMVAAHGWDITGAMRAGLQTAFIERDGKYVYPLAEKPDISTTNILTLSQELTKI